MKLKITIKNNTVKKHIQIGNKRNPTILLPFVPHFNKLNNDNFSKYEKLNNTINQFLDKNLPSVSLIVINYNGRIKLRSLFDKFMSSLLNTDYPNLDILIIDNASTDDSVNYIKRNFSDPRIRIVKLEQNMGYAGAVNLALKLSNSDIIGVMNNDLIFTDPTWLRSLINFMIKHPDIKIISPLLIYDDGTIDSAGGVINLLMVGWNLYSKKEISEIDRTKPIFTISPPGALFLIHRNSISQLGNKIFDNEYFAYNEDVELGLRACMRGWKIATIPWVTVIHKRSSSWGWASLNKFYFMRRNALFTSIKFLNIRALLFLFPIQLLSTFYAAYVYYKYSQDSKYFLVAIKIIVQVLSSFKRFYKKRELQNLRIHLKNLPISNTLILDDDNFTLVRKILLGFVNLAIILSGMKQLRIQRIEKYELFNTLKINKKNKPKQSPRNSYIG